MANWTIISAMTSTIRPGVTAATPATAGGPRRLLTEAGPVEISVPRDRDGSFEPRIVAKRQRRLTGVDDLVISLSAKGLTHGEIAAHLAEVYGAEVSKQTIATRFPVPLVGFEQSYAGAPVDNKKYGEARRSLMQQIAQRQQRADRGTEEAAGSQAGTAGAAPAAKK